MRSRLRPDARAAMRIGLVALLVLPTAGCPAFGTPGDANAQAQAGTEAEAKAEASAGGEEAISPAQDDAIASLDARFPRHVEPPKPPRPNTLSKREREAGWVLLFDGRRRPTWQTGAGEPFPEQGWTVSPRALALESAGPLALRTGGDLFTTERYRDFVLDFEFALTPGANSGVKYRARPRSRLGFVDAVGCEYQLLDDARHPDAERGRDGNRRLAGLYDLFAAEAPWPRRVGDWNHGRIHVEGNAVAHYLNGDRVLLVDFESAAWSEALSASKFAGVPDFCADAPGSIVLQDHGDAVRFRNLRIRSLDPPNGS